MVKKSSRSMGRRPQVKAMKGGNQFDSRPIVSSKHHVLNRKIRGGVRDVATARQAGLNKRAKTLKNQWVADRQVFLFYVWLSVCFLVLCWLGARTS